MSVIMYLLSTGIIKIMNLKNEIIYLVLNLFIQFLFSVKSIHSNFNAYINFSNYSIKTVNLQLLKLFYSFLA